MDIYAVAEDFVGYVVSTVREQKILLGIQRIIAVFFHQVQTRVGPCRPIYDAVQGIAELLCESFIPAVVRIRCAPT